MSDLPILDPNIPILGGEDVETTVPVDQLKLLQESTAVDVLALALGIVSYLSLLDGMAPTVIEHYAELYSEKLGGTRVVIEEDDAEDDPASDSGN